MLWVPIEYILGRTGENYPSYMYHQIWDDFSYFSIKKYMLWVLNRSTLVRHF